MGASFGTDGLAIPGRLERGEPIDAVIVAAEAMTALEAAGLVRAGSRVDLAGSGIGVAVRAGARRPDIATRAALARTLLAARSIGYSQSASGLYVAGTLFARLGIAEAVAATARMVPGMVGAAVARGEVEIGFQQISELLPVAGIDLLGPLPDAVQHVTTFSAGIVAAGDRGAAAALIGFLASADAAPAIRAAGMVPAARRRTA